MSAVIQLGKPQEVESRKGTGVSGIGSNFRGLIFTNFFRTKVRDMHNGHEREDADVGAGGVKDANTVEQFVLARQAC